MSPYTSCKCCFISVCIAQYCWYCLVTLSVTFIWSFSGASVPFPLEYQNVPARTCTISLKGVKSCILVFSDPLALIARLLGIFFVLFLSSVFFQRGIWEVIFWSWIRRQWPSLVRMRKLILYVFWKQIPTNRHIVLTCVFIAGLFFTHDIHLQLPWVPIVESFVAIFQVKLS